MAIGKKAIELQFHWIFVIIAGSLILLFFVSIAIKQQHFSKEKLQLTLANNIEHLLSNALLSRGTAQKIPIPPQGIAFECTEFCDCNFRINNAQQSFGNTIIFAPRLLRNQDLSVWTHEFKLPYRITNFLYITNPTIHYTFVTTNNPKSPKLLKEITTAFPSLISYDNITIETLPTTPAAHFDSHKFIFLHATPVQINALSLHQSFNREHFSAINIDDNGIWWYDKEGTKFSQQTLTTYLGYPSIYAAIFSQDSTMYTCGLQNMFKKLTIISQLTLMRANTLQNYAHSQNKTWCMYGAKPTCENVQTGTISAYLCTQHSLATQLIKQPTQFGLSQLASLKTHLENANRNLIQQSCPELF